MRFYDLSSGDKSQKGVPPQLGFSVLCNFDELELLSVFLKIPSHSASQGFCQGATVTLQFSALATNGECL